MKIVRIRWVDSERVNEGWVDRDTVTEWLGDSLSPYQSAGVLLAENDEWLAITMAHPEHERTGFLAPFKIPRCAVLEYEVLWEQPA